MVEKAAADFGEVFRVEYAGLVRVVAAVVGSVEDAEALVQDAFVAAYLRWSRVGRYDRPGAWIRRVAIRDGVRFEERRRRRRPEPIGTGDPTGGVADSLDLLAAIRLLPPRERACVVLHHLADEPVSEVATTLGCTESTVRVHLHRGRQALAEILGAGDAEVRREHR